MFAKSTPLACYAARTKDEKLLMDSTSGGAFTELARVILADGGVVCGAAWSQDFLRVYHKWVSSEDELITLRGSKYTVSDLSGVYGPMKRFLAEGRKVLFVGTPCQTAAMRKNFGTPHSLILCALICMTNVDAKRWIKYAMKVQRKAKSRIVGVKHRAKVSGKRGSFMEIAFEDPQSKIQEPSYGNSWWKIFATKSRKCCQQCPFRGHSAADLQIGDFWGVEKVFPEYDDGKGINAVISFSAEGEALLQRTELELKKTTYEKIYVANTHLEEQYIPPKISIPLQMYYSVRCAIGTILRKVGLR